MGKELKKNTSSEVSESLSKEEVLLRFSENHFYDSHPDNLYNEIGKILPRIHSMEDYSEEDKQMVIKGIYLNSFERSHYLVGDALNKEIGISAVEITNNLIKEYGCNTTLEKTLCEIIALNYGKVMQITKKLTGNLSSGDSFTIEKNKYLEILSKELDRANRTYLMSLNNLIEIKRPKMNINVKSKNTYIGQNQQFNNKESDIGND